MLIFMEFITGLPLHFMFYQWTYYLIFNNLRHWIFSMIKWDFIVVATVYFIKLIPITGHDSFVSVRTLAFQFITSISFR
jgi:hypothetical protein